MADSKPSRYALHLWDALKEARVIYQTCQFDPEAQQQWRGLIGFDASQMHDWMEAQVESRHHRQSIVAHLGKRQACLKEFERLVSKENTHAKARR